MIRQPYLPRLLLALLLSTVLISYGQEAIGGNVQDEIGNPIAYANVLLLNTGDSTLVKGTITEENGSFVLKDLPKGHYLVTVSLLGFKPIATDPFDFGGSLGIKLLPIILFEGVELYEVRYLPRKTYTSKKSTVWSSMWPVVFCRAVLPHLKFSNARPALSLTGRTVPLTYSNSFGNRKLKSARERGPVRRKKRIGCSNTLRILDVTHKYSMSHGADIKPRALKPSDKTQMARLANNKKIWDNVRDAFGHPYTEKNAEEFIQRQAKSETEKVFAIDCNGELCGLIGLIIQKDVYRKSAEIGYWIGELYWGRGIATQAVGLLVTHAFEKLTLVRLYAGVFEYNVGSMRVLEKNGFQKEGISKKSIFKNGKFWEEHRYAFLSDE